MTTTNVADFLRVAGRFLENAAVVNNVLLTEAHFWSSLPEHADEGHFGWWVGERDVEAAFVHLPDHPVVCSPMDQPAAASLADALPDTDCLGVQASDVESVTAAFGDRGWELRPRARMTLSQLREPFRPRPIPDGRARPANVRDLPLLHKWFLLFQQRHPEDLSHVAFVIDQPLQDGGLMIWERQGEPVGMASRTPRMAGMVRMGLAFQPSGGGAYAAAAFDAACAAAARTTDTVLVLSGTPEETSTYTSMGFVPELERVVLTKS
jgi:hypothetical protein